MAYKLIWSPAARDDLHDIVVFIARDNPERAMSFGYELISETDRLQSYPEGLGRSKSLTSILSQGGEEEQRNRAAFERVKENIK